MQLLAWIFAALGLLLLTLTLQKSRLTGKTRTVNLPGTANSGLYNPHVHIKLYSSQTEIFDIDEKWNPCNCNKLCRVRLPVVTVFLGRVIPSCLSSLYIYHRFFVWFCHPMYFNFGNFSERLIWHFLTHAWKSFFFAKHSLLWSLFMKCVWLRPCAYLGR